MSTTPSELQRTLSGVCLLMAPVFGLASEFLRYGLTEGVYFWSGVLALVSMALSVQAVLGLRHLLSTRAPRLAIYGCGLALVLMLSGPAIISTYLVTALTSPDAGAAASIEQAIFERLFPVI